MRWALITITLTFSLLGTVYAKEQGRINSESGNQAAANEQRKPDHVQPSGQAPASEQGDVKPAKAENQEYEKSMLDRIVTFATVALAIFTAGLWLATYRLVKVTRKMAQDEYLATHRPIIRVRNVVIKKPDQTQPSFFSDREPVRGQFYIANIGGSEATITGIGCWVVPRDHRRINREDFLPMARPYDGEPPNILSGGDTIKLMVGGSMPIPFAGDELLNATATRQFNLKMASSFSGWWHLYVMGYIEYFDSAGTYRTTAFCREYDPNSERFIKVSNDDYEYEA